MRMWGVNPKYMCRNHLLGEHVELHMFAGCIKKGKKLSGYIENGLVVLENLKKRHDILVKEMEKRGYKHKSPYPKLPKMKGGRINTRKNLEDLKTRCKKCRRRIKAWKKIKKQKHTAVQYVKAM